MLSKERFAPYFERLICIRVTSVIPHTKMHLHCSYISSNTISSSNELAKFPQISYVAEAIRGLASLEPNQNQQLLEELQEDIQKRQSYLQYLMGYRQNVLLTMENKFIDYVYFNLQYNFCFYFCQFKT